MIVHSRLSLLVCVNAIKISTMLPSFSIMLACHIDFLVVVTDE